ncbi:putative membrane protein [Bifidobacterium subtile]|uniref:Putative membrane protein n=2 Tax=Bifidobacterium subtile TaxID=77635 RepID=A0A087E6Z2_9BIFI|nr:putative membrane protein [Bifidobacterium subtile]
MVMSVNEKSGEYEGSDTSNTSTATSHDRTHATRTIASRARADRYATAWMVAAVALLAIGLLAAGKLPKPLWTMVHVIALGVLTNGILQWSWFFARTLLHLPAGDRHAGVNNVIRALAFNVVLVALFAAIWLGSAPSAIACDAAVIAILAWHGADLLLVAHNASQAPKTTKTSQAPKASQARFAVVIRYYATATGFLIVACVLAGFVVEAMLGTHPAAWLVRSRDALTVAHALAAVAGWVGLSIAGTLVSLGPTMLRARIDPDAPAAAQRALPVLTATLLVAVVSAAVGNGIGIGAGLLGFAGAASYGVAVPLLRCARQRPPRSLATWSMAAGVIWSVVMLIAVALRALFTTDISALRAANLPMLPLLGGGGLAQIFIAALTYLMPVVIGGGPAVMREGMQALETAWPVRFAIRNTALLLLGFTGFTSGIGLLQRVWWALVLATYVVDIALFAVAGIRQSRSKRAAAAATVATTVTAVATAQQPSHDRSAVA